MILDAMDGVFVARSTRAWIETQIQTEMDIHRNVARSTRAWIEPVSRETVFVQPASHALRVRGLKLCIKSFVQWLVRRTLYACVD